MAADEAAVIAINVAKPALLGSGLTTANSDGAWFSALYKAPVEGPIWLGELNLAGDGQADLKSHGGPDRAVCVYPFEHYSFWCSELGLQGLDRPAFGENFTTVGLDEDAVCIGDTFTIGAAVLQVTQPRLPCWKLARRFAVKDMAVRLRVTGRVGWHLRTLQPGLVEPGQSLHLVERHNPKWTIAKALSVIINSRSDRKSALELAGCLHLSAYQRRALGNPDSVPARREVED